MRLKIITINVSTTHIEELEKLVSAGYFASRSEAIRYFIHEGMIKLIQDIKMMKEICSRVLPDKQVEVPNELKNQRIIEVNGKKYYKKTRK